MPVMVGAERAVMAEEIAKHAFSLASGISRGMSQEMVTSAMFATKEEGDDDAHLGTMSTPAWAGMDDEDEEEVEDAD